MNTPKKAVTAIVTIFMMGPMASSIPEKDESMPETILARPLIESESWSITPPTVPI